MNLSRAALVRWDCWTGYMGRMRDISDITLRNVLVETKVAEHGWQVYMHRYWRFVITRPKLLSDTVLKIVGKVL